MRLRLGVGGLLVLVWAALGFFHALSSAVNHAWGVETPRSYLGQKAFALVMLLTAGLLLTAALLLASVVELAKARWFANVVVGAPALGALTSLPARWGPPALFSVVVGLIFYFAPNTTVRFRDVWIGAILTGLLWKGAFAGFSFYIRDMSRFSLVHGSVAAVVVFLIWVYVSAVILLYGVEFTVSWTQLREARRRSPEGEPSEHAEAFV
jgi:membrane protein